MVTCQQCIERQQSVDGRTFRERYEVGNPAKPQMGHAMYFTGDGRTALCAATPKAEIR